MNPASLGARAQKVRFIGGKPVLRRAFAHYAPASFSQSGTTVRERSEAQTVVTVRYFAAARAAAGLPSEFVDVGDGATVTDALDVISRRHGEPLRRVLSACSILLDSVAVRDRATPLRPGSELDVLPPFAGG